MSKTWKKMFALLLTLCTVVGLAVPTVSAAEDTASEGYVFPEFGETIYLGEPLLGEMTLTEYALKVEKDGKEYLMAPAKGGTLYVFKLTDYVNGDNSSGTWIEASANDGIQIPRGIVADSNGLAYVIGDSSTVFCFDLFTGNSYDIFLPNNGANGISVDENDNIYVSNRGCVAKIETKNNNKVTTFYDCSESFTMAMANVVGDGYLYVTGTKKGAANGMEVHKIDLATGKLVSKASFDNAGGMYYLSYIDGVVFVGHSASHSEGMIAIDTATMQEIDIGVDRWLMGVVTNPKDGKSYMMVNGLGVHEYDLATRKATPVEGLGAVNVNLRIRDPYVNMTYENVSGEAIITMASGGALPTLMSLEGKGFVDLETLVEEAKSPAVIRSVQSGVPGVLAIDPGTDMENVLDVQAAEVAAYIGGYLSGGVGRYSPDLEDDDRLNNRVFSNGHAQTDSMIVYKNKLYGGAYNGGYLWEFDPATGVFTELIHGLKDDYGQIRIHGLAAGDDRIFFSTVPGDKMLGGSIGWYDLTTGEFYCERNVVFEQSIISITYDEENDILYGASSTAGGTNTTATQTEAKVLVYDVANKKKLGEFSVRASENPNSDMVFDLEAGAKVPEYISCVARDPDTGKYWGLVSNTLFSFEYDEASNTMKVHEELACGGSATMQKGRYPHGGSNHWFPRNIFFDGKGNMYMSFEAVGHLRRVNASNPSDNVLITTTGGRVYCLGSDGNLYIGSGTELYTVALNRTSIVKNMIAYTEPADAEGIAEARLAYDALTDEERAELGEDYYNGLVALEGAGDIFVEVAAEKAMEAIDEIGAVTASSAGSILAARMEYDSLSEEGRAQVANYDALTKAEEAYAAITAKTTYGPDKRIELLLGAKWHDRAKGVGLQAVTYDHITGGVWEYADGSASANAMKFNGGDHIQLAFGSSGNWIAFRFKANEAGVYDLTAQTKAYNGCIGGVYIFDDPGLVGDALYTPIDLEVMMMREYTTNYIGKVDYTVDGTQSVGTWNCETPGEYILVLNLLEVKDGHYGRLMNITMTAKNPVTDSAVEMAKDRINAIGKVTKKSGTAINEARITYDALTDAQKALIYAPQLEVAEAAYAEIAAQAAIDEAAAAVVEIEINAIGEVTVGSGSAIQSARDAYDALTKDQQKLVTNEKVLKDAEKAYKALTAQTRGDGGEEGNTMTVVIIVIVAVVVIAAVVVVLVLNGKKKKKAAAPAAEEPAEEAPTVEEILDK